MRLDKDSSPWCVHRATAWMIDITLRLQVSCCRATGYNLHALFALIRGRKRTLIARSIIVVKNNNFTKGLLYFIALLTGFVSPFLEFGEGNVFHFLSCVHPAAGFQQLVVVCVHMADVSDHGKLDPSG